MTPPPTDHQNHDYQDVGMDIPTFVPFVTSNDRNEHRIELQIKGAKCAACIQKIESSFQNNPSVTHARLNFSNGRLAVEWNSAASDIDQYVKNLRDLGYGVHCYAPNQLSSEQSDDENFLLKCLGVSAFAMGNIMLLSFALWSTTKAEMGEGMRLFLDLAVATIAMPTIAYAGQPFFRSAASVLKHGRTNMDVPISLGVILACIISVIGLFERQEHLYFDSAVMLIFFLLMGRYLDARVRQKAKSAASDLLQMMVQVAVVEQPDGTRAHIDVRNIRPDMIMHVAVGERIAADSEVLDGKSEIDMSLVTGETMPVTVDVGSKLYAGTLNIQSPLKVRVTKAANDSLLADIVRLVEKAESVQALYVRIADRAAKLYTPFVHALAAVTFVGWMLAGLPFMDCLMRATTVLIITCPCALGLAVPVVQVLAVSRLMKAGILVKDGAALEKLSKIDTVIFDKTGTLTRGKPVLMNRESIAESDVQLAASMASKSRHPLAMAVAQSWSGPLLDVHVNEIAGSGIESDTGIRLGRFGWVDATEDGAENARAAHAGNTPDGYMHLYLKKSTDSAPIQFLFKDDLKLDASETIKTLKSNNLKLHILSGDREGAVRMVAEQVSVESYKSNCRPEDKVNFIEAEKEKGHNVLMVGDGLNDTPVLAAAHIAMSPSSAIDMAQNTASIIFSGGKLKPIIDAWLVACDSQTKIKQNFALAIIYNVFAVPLAVMGYVTPLIAAIAMSSSSLIVIGNSLRLRKVK